MNYDKFRCLDYCYNNRFVIVHTGVSSWNKVRTGEERKMINPEASGYKSGRALSNFMNLTFILEITLNNKQRLIKNV